MTQEIVDFTGTETFAKEPKLVKLFRELNLLRLGTLLRDSMYMGAFSPT